MAVFEKELDPQYLFRDSLEANHLLKCPLIHVLTLLYIGSARVKGIGGPHLNLCPPYFIYSLIFFSLETRLHIIGSL